MAETMRARGEVVPPSLMHADSEVVDGVARLTDDAARSVGDMLAARYGSLLDRLAND
ncbi:hypothetical protein [Microbacterium sp. che218]|uniref:hypothetical protein n=1 Tax=Microbacterium sp. che218 TaxID=3140649 RepID=UPI003366F2B5